MNSISGIVIAKNEENRIADCLDSLSFCDETIVIDGGSEDRTIDIAARMGARVFTLASDDFSRLRNFGLTKAKGEWVLYVDADERVTLELARNIKSQLSKPNYSSSEAKRSREVSGDNSFRQARTITGFVTAFKIKRKNFYFGNQEWPYIENLERLFKKSSLKGWKGMLHESPIVDGQIGALDGFLLHYSHRDLSSMLAKTIEWSQIEAELRFKSDHPQVTWWRFFRVMITVFFDSYIKQRGWKVGTVGLIESMYQSFSIFITYARLWEMQQKKNYEKIS